MLFQCLLKLNRRPGHQQLGERGIISHVLKLAKSFSLSGNISHAAKNLPVRAPKKIAFEVQNTFFLGGVGSTRSNYEGLRPFTVDRADIRAASPFTLALYNSCKASRHFYET